MDNKLFPDINMLINNEIVNIDYGELLQQNNEITFADVIDTYKPEFDDYYIIKDGKLLDKNEIIDKSNNGLNNNELIIIDVYERQNGGGLIDMFMGIIQIGKVFLKIGDFIIWIGKFILWFIFFLGWVITDFLNPIKLFTDFFNGFMVLLISICRLPFDVLLGMFAFFVNGFGSWMQGFWGWDNQFTTKLDKNSDYLKKLNLSKGKKCYLTNTNKVPFSILLGTLICPPLGVFMDVGLTGWFNILICILLTFLFYIPGLAYALLIIYS